MCNHQINGRGVQIGVVGKRKKSDRTIYDTRGTIKGDRNLKLLTLPDLMIKEEKMSLLAHAEKEFELAGWKEKGTDESQGWIMDNIRELLTVFSKQGHSGSSAPYVINLFKKLASYEIITPLTGKDDEWMDVSDGLFQNKRDSRVFKKDGNAYFIDGKAFSDDGGKTFWTNGKSHTPVTFPCDASLLKTEYIVTYGDT